MPIKLAISTCPNDTFAFHAILENKIDRCGLDLDIQLLDIQQLNDGLFAGAFDVAKASFHAAALLTDSTLVLPSGSAVGFGVGPLLLAAQDNTSPDTWPPNAPSSTLCPGQHTTAAMLFQMFYGEAIKQNRTIVSHTLFSDIMPALKNGNADFGVCIHEGRFTWEEQGLACVTDLGTCWEKETQAPLPLGGILAKRELPEDTISQVQSLIKRSIEYGLANRNETAETMRRHAQELDDDVLFSHVDLYVNDWTVDLGSVGESALKTLSHAAKGCGLVASSKPDIEVWR